MTRIAVILFLLATCVTVACGMRSSSANSWATSTYPQPRSTLSAVVIPVEFPDLEHSVSIETAQFRFSIVDLYYQRESYGQVQIGFHFTTYWYKSNMQLSRLDIQRWNFNRTDMDIFTQESIEAADDEIDFRDYDIVFILAAGLVHPNAACIDAPTKDVVASLKVAVVNEMRDERTYAHELGHLLASSYDAKGCIGLPDFYSYELAAKNQTADVWIGSWDLMSNSTQLPGLSAWSKITLRWIAPKMIAIEQSSIVPVRLNSLESNSGPRAIVVPINKTTSYVIEVRERFEEPINNVFFFEFLPSEGVLIYIADLTKQSGYGVLRIIDGNPATETLNDAPLHKGDLFEDEENRIYVLVASADDDSYTIIFSGMKNSDYDGDTLSDWREVNECRTDPLKADTDGDYWRDDKDPSPTDAMIPNAIIAVAAIAVTSIVLLFRRSRRHRAIFSQCPS